MQPNSPDGLDEALAGMYEILKRHEETLHALVVDAEALKSALPGYERDRVEAAREKALLAARDGHEATLRLFDEAIAQLRSK